MKTAVIAAVESIASTGSLARAWEHVRSNHGAPGIDGITIEAFDADFSQALVSIQSDLLAGTYHPQPVRALQQRKESGDGFRTLGIPTVRDRLVLQAIAQVLTPLWEPHFSPCSFAYRPERSAHDAVAAAQTHLRAGRHWVVDLDIEGFFDHVDHARLMVRLAQRISDARVLALIAAFLRAGRRREDGTVESTPIGIAQGSPLSPLLANIVLDELDQEYTRLGRSFVRYADDCILLADSQAEARAILDFTAGFLEDRLKLRLHPLKTRIVRPADTDFLGFTYRLSRYGHVRRHITRDAREHFRERIVQLAQPTGRSFEQIVARVGSFVRAWSIYYAFCEDGTLQGARAFARARLRACAWLLWGTSSERQRQLIRRGVSQAAAEAAAGALLFPDQLRVLPVLAQAFPNQWFDPYGLGDKPPRLPRTQRTAAPPVAPPPLLAYLTGPAFRRQMACIARTLRDRGLKPAGPPSAASAIAEALDALAAIQTTLQRMLGPARFPGVLPAPKVAIHQS